MSETPGPSDHASTHGRLRASLREFPKLKKYIEKYPLPKESNANFQDILNIVTDKDNCIVKPTQEFEIVKSLGKSYDDENSFDLDLFQALSEDLRAIGIDIEVLEETPTSEKKGEGGEKKKVLKYIILPYKCGEYHFGFVRQTSGAKGVPGKSEEDPARASYSVKESGARESICDHCCCLLEKITEGKNVNWKVCGIFSVVDLKMGNTSSKCDTSLLEDGVNMQPISCVLESVWPSLCRFGLGDEVELLPIALIAAKKRAKKTEDPPAQGERNSSAKKTHRNRWVKGNLILPTGWGRVFSLFQSGSQCFDSSGGQNNEEGPRTAANLYTETMLEGLKLCQELSQKCKAKGDSSPFDFYPSLLTGPHQNDLNNKGKLVALPLLSSKEVEEWQSEGDFFHITQGELYFFENLNLKKMNELAPNQPPNFWLISDDAVKNVLVKVWWNGVHRYLQGVGEYKAAFENLHYQVISNTERDAKKMDKLKESLSEVLLGMVAIVSPPISFTFMRKATGQSVKLEENKTLMIEYWAYFKALCKDVLLPLADMGITYKDLRPGSDCTHNVLLVEDKAGETKKKMVLVDYESLALGPEYQPPSSADGRYPKTFFPDREEIKSHNCLFQQCVGIAFSWIEGRNLESFSFEDALVWWSNIMELEESSQIDGSLLEAQRQDALESSLEWWADMLPRESSIDTGKTKAAFDSLFGKLDTFIQKTQGETTNQKTPCAKSHTVTAEFDATKDRKKQRTS